MKYILDLDISRCSACGACMIACMDQNDTDVAGGAAAFRQVYEVDAGGDGEHKFRYLSVSCMHCEDAPCVAACPSACLYKDPDSGMTLFDNTNCIGCHSCAMACPFGAPTFGADGKMTKCDGCIERVKAGLEPACVRICPTKALRLYTEEEYAEVLRDRSLRRLAQKI